jgi:hypothetical protein
MIPQLKNWKKLSIIWYEFLWFFPERKKMCFVCKFNILQSKFCWFALNIIHYLANASFLQDMLLGMFAILQKLHCSSLQNMLLGFCFCFFFYVHVIIFVQHCSRSTSLISVWHLLCCCPSLTVKSFMSPFQGQGQRSRSCYGQSRVSTKPLFLSRCYQINSKLGVKV